MVRFVALLRAVNVGGTGKLPMADLRSICTDAGLQQVQTYIASGNVIFQSRFGEKRIKRDLEQRLLAYAGKPIDVLVRNETELKKILSQNPFKGKPANQTLITFLNDAPPSDAGKHISGAADEKIVLGTREIYVHYPDGVSQSRLKIPAAKFGTARNLNTLRKLVELVDKGS